MSVGTDTLQTFERARWARQVTVLQAWLATLDDVEPRPDALRSAFAGADVPHAAGAQMRFDLERDLQRLGAAIGGKTPSAVDPARPYASPRSFARDEAVHTLDNAVVFSKKAVAAETLSTCGAEVARAQRWIQRLRWELVDTEVDAPLPLGFSADAVGADLRVAQQLAKDVLSALATLRDRLCPPAPAG